MRIKTLINGLKVGGENRALGWSGEISADEFEMIKALGEPQRIEAINGEIIREDVRAGREVGNSADTQLSASDRPSVTPKKRRAGRSGRK